ncbi:MAG: sugar phosphate isomerase/epimerase [Thermoleophilia bacterium]|nr:sugar phosphate isomerase/epimerase [Thermoleophilia bacterium]
MLVGSMNHPGRPLEAELERIAAAGFEFVDLTLEPPCAWPVEGAWIGERLQALGLRAVGHTAPYLPIASPFPELQSGAHASLVAAFDVFAAAGIRLVNVHPDALPPLVPRAELRERNAEAVARLAEAARERGLRLMVENLGSFGTVEDLGPLFAAAPEVGFHLDVGHAHLAYGAAANPAGDLLAAFADRLAHVHVSDNPGDRDLHLPLGAAAVDWPVVARALRDAGWDGTVTLEVVSKRREYLEVSRRLWLEWWAAADQGSLT